MAFRPCARLLLAAAALLCGASAAEAQLQVPVQFDFLNPSARSLALGGAFVGLADDATAALVNPAGLIELTRKEISIEGAFATSRSRIWWVDACRVRSRGTGWTRLAGRSSARSTPPTAA